MSELGVTAPVLMWNRQSKQTHFGPNYSKQHGDFTSSKTVQININAHCLHVLTCNQYILTSTVWLWVYISITVLLCVK